MGVEIDVVISGGSIEGICDATGFLKALTVDLGHKIVSAAGASAGGIILSAFASGRPIEEIEKIVVGTDIGRFVKIPRIWQIYKIWKAFSRGWVSDGVALEDLMACMTGYKTLNDVELDLHIAASDFTNGTLIDLCKAYDPTMPLHKVMRITSCVPGLFKQVEFKDIVWYDGSIRSYFPIELLPPSDRPCYGFISQPIDSRTFGQRLSTYGVLAGLVNHSVDANIRSSIRLSGRRPVLISHKDAHVGTYDFGVSTSEKIRLIESARQATLRRLST
jgi:predicted acylesterase/phospholipase RssA